MTRQANRSMTQMRLIVLALLFPVLGAYACTKTIPGDTVRKLDSFLRTTVASTLEQDYQSHRITVRVTVHALTMDRVTQRETAQDHVYLVRGTVTYSIHGSKRWKDPQGNVVELAPGQEITHWFTCGVLEDKYLGTLFQDERNRLAFFAEKPE